jgi:hypothetical protein
VNVTDVLSGTVNARLKLKFLFFSKSWRKQLFKFDGFCEDGCNHALFAEQCNLGAPRTVAWGRGADAHAVPAAAAAQRRTCNVGPD